MAATQPKGPKPLLGIVQYDRDPDREEHQRPLDFGLIRRLFSYTRPYAKRRNALVALVIVRSIQLPLLSWVIASVISGPIARHDDHGTLIGALCFVGLVLLTDLCHHFRIRLALELGEAV